MINNVRNDMIVALKAGDTARKLVLSNILNVLQAREKVGDTDFDSAILKYLKQVNESISTCPSSRKDALDELMFERSVVEEYAPKLMSEVEIVRVIKGVLSEFETPTKSDKGNIMKKLMPLVKGKADGKLVNQLLMNELM